MADNVTTQIESKTRVSRHINLSSLYFIVGYLMFAYMLKDFIYSLFFVPYMIFSLCCAVYLVLPSRYNKGRANWESIVVLLRADRAVYRPYAEQEVDGHGVSVACRSSASSSCWAICFSFQPVFLCRSITRM